jgi:hypothetical protein
MRKLSDRACLILGLLSLVLLGLYAGCARRLQDAPLHRFAALHQTQCSGHCWSGTYACGFKRRCCSKCNGRCGW